MTLLIKKFSQPISESTTKTEMSIVVVSLLPYDIRSHTLFYLLQTTWKLSPLNYPPLHQSSSAAFITPHQHTSNLLIASYTYVHTPTTHGPSYKTHYHHRQLQSTRNTLDYPTSNFWETLFSFGLQQLVTQPTLTHGNILNLVICDREDMISNLTVDSITCSLKSDHYLISFDAPFSIPTAQGKKNCTLTYMPKWTTKISTHSYIHFNL